MVQAVPFGDSSLMLVALGSANHGFITKDVEQAAPQCIMILFIGTRKKVPPIWETPEL